MKSIVWSIFVFVMILFILFGTIKIRGCVHYNLYYKKHIKPEMSKVEKRIDKLEERIEILEGRK